MFELEKLGEKTYCIKSICNVGIYVIKDNDICLIDTGVNDSTGKKIWEVIEKNNWNLTTIINTHYHADHSGANAYLYQKSGCKIYSSRLETVFMSNFEIAPAQVFGGFPINNILNQFMLAKSSPAEELTNDNIPSGLEFINIKGHSIDHIAIKTSDDVWFLGDGVVGKDILRKCHISFNYDIKSYLDSLDIIENLQGKYFVPAHSDIITDIKDLANYNKQNVQQNIDLILSILTQPKTFDDILACVYSRYDLLMNLYHYTLNGSVVKSYLSYLYNEGRIETFTIDNHILWKVVE